MNIAMVLQKPLLIKGEPGTGKTMLAEAISQALGKTLIIWNIKSTTKAQDGLYVYDVVQRLYDSQFGGQGVDDIAIFRFTEKDVVRHKLVQDIIRAYEAAERRQNSDKTERSDRKGTRKH